MKKSQWDLRIDKEQNPEKYLLLESMNEIKEIIKGQNTLLQNQLETLNNISSYSHTPFASLLMSELTSHEDMDGNNLLFCIDFIFDVPYSHLSPLLKSTCQMFWTNNTEEDYNYYRETKQIEILSFEEYRDSLSNTILRTKVDLYIKSYTKQLKGMKEF